MHNLCAGVKPSPPGMYGGSKCICDCESQLDLTLSDDDVSAIEDALKNLIINITS